MKAETEMETETETGNGNEYKQMQHFELQINAIYWEINWQNDWHYILIVGQCHYYLEISVVAYFGTLVVSYVMSVTWVEEHSNSIIPKAVVNIFRSINQYSNILILLESSNTTLQQTIRQMLHKLLQQHQQHPHHYTLLLLFYTGTLA